MQWLARTEERRAVCRHLCPGASLVGRHLEVSPVCEGQQRCLDQSPMVPSLSMNMSSNTPGGGVTSP